MPQANLQLLTSGESSDFTIICQGVEFKVHKDIVCPESSFFRAACTNNFKECHEATLSLPEEDPEIFARVLLWLYTGDVDTEEIEKTLAELVPGAPTTDPWEVGTHVLVYFCADRQGIESMKLDLATKIRRLILWFEEGDMNGHFAALLEKVYNDIPAKDDPLRIQITVETLRRLWYIHLLRPQDMPSRYMPHISDDGDDDGDDNNDDNSNKDALKRIQTLIWANEPSAWEIAVELIATFE